MHQNSIRLNAALWLLTIISIAITGCSDKHVAGKSTGTETTDDYIATILLSQGTPAARIQVLAMPSNTVVDTQWIRANGTWETLPNSVLDSTDTKGRIQLDLDSGSWSIYAKNNAEVIHVSVSCDKTSCIGDSLLSMMPAKTVLGSLHYTQCDSHCGNAWIRIPGLPIGAFTTGSEYHLQGIPAGDFSIEIQPQNATAFGLTSTEITVDSSQDSIILAPDTLQASPIQASIWKHIFSFESDSSGVASFTNGTRRSLAVSWSQGLQTLTLGVRFKPDTTAILSNLVMDSAMSFRIGYGYDSPGAFSSVLVNNAYTNNDYYSQPQESPIDNWNTTWACLDINQGKVLWKVNSASGSIDLSLDSISLPQGPLHIGGSWYDSPTDLQNFQGAIDEVWMGENLPCDSTWMSYYPD